MLDDREKIAEALKAWPNARHDPLGVLGRDLAAIAARALDECERLTRERNEAIVKNADIASIALQYQRDINAAAAREAVLREALRGLESVVAAVRHKVSEEDIQPLNELMRFGLDMALVRALRTLATSSPAAEAMAGVVEAARRMQRDWMADARAMKGEPDITAHENLTSALAAYDTARGGKR
jgi:hypothetical protein